MTDTATGAYPPRSQAWLSTVIIFLLTAIALADRMAISMLIGPIKAEFGIGDFQASLLVGLAFTLFYVLFLFPIGAAADRLSRRKVLAVCLAVWSLATVLCGFATGFISLFLLRMLMGAGEAAIGPCSQGIIGNSFPLQSLAKPMALQGIGFQAGPAIGVAAAGAILGAGAAGAFEGVPLLADLAPWRVAFILIGLPGLLALLLIPFLRDPGEGRARAQAGSPVSVLPFLKAHAGLIALLFVQAGCSAIATGVITGWVPEYLQRSLGASPAEAGSALGLIMLSAAFIGQGLLAVAIDFLAARGRKDAPILAGIVPVALSIPLAWIAFSASDAAAFYPLLMAFALCVASFNAIYNTLAQQIAPPALRSRVAALVIFSISIIGFALGPALVGALSEYVLGEARLGEAMRMVATGSLVVTLALLLASWKPLLAYMQAKEAA
jgi:MFS family permease